jgi:hypothetical protein
VLVVEGCVYSFDCASDSCLADVENMWKQRSYHAEVQDAGIPIQDPTWKITSNKHRAHRAM